MKKEKFLWILAVIVYSITAYYSNGFHHADEHFQIYEFADARLGNNSKYAVPWEYAAKIRPSIQPTLSIPFIQLFRLRNTFEPHQLTFLMRLLTSFGFLAVLFSFYEKTKDRIGKEFHLAYLFSSLFLWFIPFIAVRFSSETLSTIFFVWGINKFLDIDRGKFNSNISFLFIGLLWGISFQFRFQMAIAISGLIIWAFFIKKISFQKLTYLGTGALIILLFGFLLDSWFYREWVFTPFRYFHVNLIEGKSKDFGMEHWSYYLDQVAVKSIFPIGVLLISAFVFGLLKLSKSIITWAIAPFVITHILISHKELRFLFPIAIFVPFLVIKLVVFIKEKHIDSSWKKIIFTISLWGLVTCNLLGLGAIMLLPANMGHVAIIKYIHENYSDKPINLIHSFWSNPYSPTRGVQMDFYRPPKLSTKLLDGMALDKFEKSLLWEGRHDLLVLRQLHVNKFGEDFIKELGYKRVHASLPLWFVNKALDWYSSKEVLVLYKFVGEY